jgi:hypothetical protein
LNFIEGIQQHDGWFDNARLQQEIDQNKAEVNSEDVNGRAARSLERSDFSQTKFTAGHDLPSSKMGRIKPSKKLIILNLQEP